MVDLRRPTMMPVFTEPMRNIVPNLVYSAQGDEVALVSVEGRVIYEQGRVQTVDEAQVLAQAERLAGPIGPQAAVEFSRVNGTNAQFMRDQKL